MKTNKLFFPAIILIVSIITMAVYSTVTNIAKKPVITEKEFPFSITYKLNGKTETTEGIYAVSFAGNDGYTTATFRVYKGTIISQQEYIDTSYVVSESDDGVIILYTNLHADHLMGDSRYDYFSYDPFEPVLVYYDLEGCEYNDTATVLEHGAQIISWEYPEPIENTFVFSHIAHLSSDVVFPLTLIAALTLLAIIIFVRKDSTFKKQRMDIVSILLNFVIALVFVPFTVIFGCLSDINGSSAALAHQLGYLVPAITLLGLAASVSLRRKGFHTYSLIIQFVGLIAFGFILSNG